MEKPRDSSLRNGCIQVHKQGGLSPTISCTASLPIAVFVCVVSNSHQQIEGFILQATLMETVHLFPGSCTGPGADCNCTIWVTCSLLVGRWNLSLAKPG